MPYKDLPEKTRELIFKGTSDIYGLDDFFEELESKRYKLHVRVFLSRYRKAVPCKSCGGSRLRPEALAFTIGGTNIATQLLVILLVSAPRHFFQPYCFYS